MFSRSSDGAGFLAQSHVILIQHSVLQVQEHSLSMTWHTRYIALCLSSIFLCQFEELCPWPVFPVWFIQTPTLSHWCAHKSFCSVLFILHFDKRSHQDFDYDKKTPLYRVTGPPHALFLLNSLQWPLIRLQINELTQIINYISTPVSKVFLSVVYAISCQPCSEIVNETCLELKVRIRFHTVY